jgi:hypothetical protein
MRDLPATTAAPPTTIESGSNTSTRTSRLGRETLTRENPPGVADDLDLLVADAAARVLARVAFARTSGALAAVMSGVADAAKADIAVLRSCSRGE